MNITSQTQKVGLIGHPVGHSKSPEMMNTVFRSMNLSYLYLAYDVPPQSLGKAVEGMKALGFCGWNVTLPHKQAIKGYLDVLTPTAQAIGAVNTVMFQDGKWIGHNTDAEGYLCSLVEETSINLSNQHVVILGAGGAARAVGYALARAGINRLIFANRTVEKAEKLASDLLAYTETQAVSLEDCQQHVKEASLLVNATSVGMYPHESRMPIPPAALHSGLVVSDLVYNPRETALLLTAKAVGATIHTGIGMLVHQGARAFQCWTGKRAPIDEMRKVLGT